MSAMRNDVGVLLYRRVLKSLAVVERYGANHIVLGRYAEYIPKSVTVEKNETLNAIARKVFVTTSSGPGSLGTAFSFLKDITESFADMELQALWESYSRKDDYELVEGMAIVSTALHLAGELQPIRSGCLTAAVAKTMDDVHKFLEEMKRVLMDHLCSLQSKRKSVPQSFLLTVISVLHQNGYGARDASPEDYGILGLLRDRHSSVLVLNALLVVVLRNLNVTCSLVGMSLHEPWVRVQQTGGRALLLSIAREGGYRISEVADMMKGVHQQPQWWRPTEWDSSCRKHIIFTLLRKQLLMLTLGASTAQKLAKQKACRSQILFLLS